jgi:predicted kinase
MADRAPVLVVLSGRPGVGKTTISRRLGASLRAAVLRVDVIESAITRSGTERVPVGPVGYAVAAEVARSCLAVGTPVVVDAVNPVPEARAGWPVLAAEIGAEVVLIEVVMGDAGEHRRRVEARESDVDGLIVPSWDDVLTTDYVPWDEPRDGPRLVVDGADCDAAVATIAARLRITAAG